MTLSIPISLDIEIPSGDDQTFTQTIKDKAGLADIDFSGYGFIFTLKKTKTEYTSDANAVYQLKDSDPEITVSVSGTPFGDNHHSESFCQRRGF